MDNFKKALNEKIKQYSNEKYLDDYIKKEFITEDGDADIFIYLNNIDELVDSRTRGEQTELNNDIYEYFESKSSMLDNDTKISFHIEGLDLTNKDKELVRHLFKEHYAIELYKAQREYIGIRNKIFKLVLIGILSFLIYVFFFFNTSFDFFVEVFGFIFSFALWEGFDAIIYALNEAKDNREAATQNLLTEIKFE